MNFKNMMSLLLVCSLISTSASALSLNFLKRGFKHCTGVCDQPNMCNDQEKLEWCLLNCSHKMDVKNTCTKEKIRASVDDIVQNKEKLSKDEQALVEQLMEPVKQ